MFANDIKETWVFVSLLNQQLSSLNELLATTRSFEYMNDIITARHK